jgi:dihydrofolate reductase
MSRVRVHNFSVSLDGYGTGEGQSLEAPFGHASGRLMNWGPGIGAEIMGRNKFGPQRGLWEDEEWKGWWGDDPVFHTPVFVLTHHPSPAEALAAAREAAADLIDHMRIALVPIVLGRGERLWDGSEGLEERFDIETVSSPSGVTHLTCTRR